MKTSRIARETAKVTTAINALEGTPRRLTRAFATSLASFNAASPPVKEEKVHDAYHISLSQSIDSGNDIEDIALGTPGSSKRKRANVETDSAVSASSTPASSARRSPRKNAVEGESGAEEFAKKRKVQPAKRIVGDNWDVKIEPPSGWEDVYEAVKEMRKERNAPVDTMGCETLADENLSPRDRRFQTLIALMMSSQTKDTTNAVAMKRLQTELPSPGLTLENILAVDPVKLNEMIYVVGFHNTKTKHIKMAAEILRDQWDGDIPDTIEGLMSLPGVGPKMAYLCLSAAWNRTEGIGVDVHVHRITNLWRWHKTKGPEETRISLESWLPKEKWHEINHLLVGFGQTICTPVGRKCENCELSKKGYCPSAVVEKKISKKRVKTEVVKVDDDIKENVVQQEQVATVKVEPAI